MTQCSLKVIDASWELIAMENPSFYLMSLFDMIKAVFLNNA